MGTVALANIKTLGGFSADEINDAVAMDQLKAKALDDYEVGTEHGVPYVKVGKHISYGGSKTNVYTGGPLAPPPYHVQNVKTKVYHTGGKDDYGTPQALYNALALEFHFNLDVCANLDNHKCSTWIGEDIDALTIDWWGRVWMNPPFSKLDQFLSKMIKELVDGHIELGVALIAARSDTQAMFTASSYAGETRFLKGRVSYQVYPTQAQRMLIEKYAECYLDGTVVMDWPEAVKEIGLPKTAILALANNPGLPGGHPDLSIGAPFPSTVLVFDRRPTPSVVWWDWKKQLKTVYRWGPEASALAIKQAGQTAGWKKTPTFTKWTKAAHISKEQLIKDMIEKLKGPVGHWVAPKEEEWYMDPVYVPPKG